MTKHDQLVNALNKLVPNANYGVRGEKIEWHDKKINQPSKSELETAMAEAVEDEKKLKYRHSRYKEYPQIGEQLDMLFHAIDAGKVDKTSDFYKSLKAVKDKYPKG